MDIVFHGHLRELFGCGLSRADIHIEPIPGEPGCDLIDAPALIAPAGSAEHDPGSAPPGPKEPIDFLFNAVVRSGLPAAGPGRCAVVWYLLRCFGCGVHFVIGEGSIDFQMIRSS